MASNRNVGSPKGSKPVRLVLSQKDVLTQERDVLGLEGTEAASAICLSGGGIRSAAFCLGVLQSLAARSLLDQFCYLSTVSGGGYIGGWLTRAIAQPSNADQSLREVLAGILERKDGVDPRPIANLRRYTSFLAPQRGLASTDTWAGIVLWLRNTLVNWLVFLPVMLAVTALPLAYFGLVSTLRSGIDEGCDQNGLWLATRAALAAASLGLLCLGLGVYRSCVELPSHSHADSKDTEAGQQAKKNRFEGTPSRSIMTWTIGSICLWALLAPVAVAPLAHPREQGQTVKAALIDVRESTPPRAARTHPDAAHDWVDPVVGASSSSSTCADIPDVIRYFIQQPAALPLASFLVNVLAYGLAWWKMTARSTYKKGYADRQEKEARRTKHRRAFTANLGGWVISTAISALLLWLGTELARSANVLWLVCLGPFWVIGTELIRSTLYAATRIAGVRSDLDREWLGRLNAIQLRAAVLAGSLCAAALYLPQLILDHGDSTWHWLVGAGGLLAGPVAASIGKSAKTVFAPDAPKEASWLSWLKPNAVVSVAVAVFALSLLILLGRLDAKLGIFALQLLPVLPLSAQFASLLGFGLLLTFVCTCLTVFVDRRVDLNQFSMHAVYRNRLVRAFLGSGRPDSDRLPDGFTGFDPKDDVRVADVLDQGRGTGCKRKKRTRLFPVINVALNVTTGTDVARAERKAESFTITPLHCGSAFLRRKEGRQMEGAYVPTATYAGNGRETGPGDKERGITLGGAMTISGAAVSPNMGYQSSMAGAFVMTLFNVRLGAWLPNPNVPEPRNSDSFRKTRTQLNRSGPRLAVSTLLDELRGRSDAEGDYIYLSDGGHFDNLGLYEMLRRRCGNILIVDAGRDEHYAYSDLGRTLQRALIDLGVGVEFSKAIKVGDSALQQRGAYAKVRYPASGTCPAATGKLVYLKPWLPPNAPSELQAFKALRGSFPHESTADQFFTESDFESYRRLGEYLFEELLVDALSNGSTETLLRTANLKLDQVFDGIERAASG